jgi:hypothetical protein
VPFEYFSSDRGHETEVQPVGKDALQPGEPLESSKPLRPLKINRDVWGLNEFHCNGVFSFYPKVQPQSSR